MQHSNDNRNIGQSLKEHCQGKYCRTIYSKLQLMCIVLATYTGVNLLILHGDVEKFYNKSSITSDKV